MGGCPICGTEGGDFDLRWDPQAHRQSMTFKACGHTFFRDRGEDEWRTEVVFENGREVGTRVPAKVLSDPDPDFP